MYLAVKAAASHAHKRLIPAWLLHFGAAGVFVVALLDASPIPLPIPGSTDILILILGAHGEWPWLLALASVSGSLIGGYLTWKTGKEGGEAMLDRTMKNHKRLRARLTGWIRGHGIASVCIAALLPPPIPLMPFVLGAGALGVTRRQLLIALGIARTIRYGAEAAVALIYGHRILRWANHYLAGWSNVILYSFLSLLVAGILFSVWKCRRDHRGETRKQQGTPRAA